jgi:hypothetical protein
MNADLCFGFSKSKWEDLSPKLDANDEDAWKVGIAVFERRMRERFLSSIEALFASDTKPDLSLENAANAPQCIPGFAIMALCCLLIETVQGFREDSPAAATPSGPCPYPQGKCIEPPPGTNQLFIKFLRRPAFGEAFVGGIASKFNRGIRNGILHEAETRKWVVWREEPGGKIVAKEGDGYALNRTLFYDALKKEFESYLQELRDPGNAALRQRFKEKMDALSEET